MPRKPLKGCKYPGCPKLIEVGETYCPEHKKIVDSQYDKSFRNKKHIEKYGTQWRKIRNRYASKHPLCERCLSLGRYTPMSEVHHILPIKMGGTNDEKNLMSVCHSCHEYLHAELDKKVPK